MMFANCLKKISQRSLGAVSDFQFQSSAYIFGLTYLAYQINKKNYGTSLAMAIIDGQFYVENDIPPAIHGISDSYNIFAIYMENDEFFYRLHNNYTTHAM